MAIFQHRNRQGDTFIVFLASDLRGSFRGAYFTDSRTAWPQFLSRYTPALDLLNHTRKLGRSDQGILCVGLGLKG